jgi:protein tyrosine phosphatase (PTP) superfamily phosphohydrolase (DUF442 family)
VNLHNIVIQMAFMYAPLMSHGPIEQVTPNLMRGPDPKVADIYALRDNGVKTIISLRTNPEHKKQELCKKLGIKWIQIKTGVFKTPTDEQFDEFRQIVDDPKNQPCYSSCEIDMDRTGVYIAAYRMVDQHWTSQQMVDEFTSHHQKKWWPVFRKYEGKVVAYANKRNAPGADTQVSTTLSTSAEQLAQKDATTSGQGSAITADTTQTKSVVSAK